MCNHGSIHHSACNQMIAFLTRAARNRNMHESNLQTIHEIGAEKLNHGEAAVV
jgi:hypothetical protein